MVETNPVSPGSTNRLEQRLLTAERNPYNTGFSHSRRSQRQEPISLKNIVRHFSDLVTATLLLIAGTLILTGCGQTYRPIAIPVTQPGGDPENPHYAIVLSRGSSGNGSFAQINVSGDTNVGNKTIGADPVHAMLLPSLGSGWIVNRGDSTVTTYAPSVISAAGATIALEGNAGASFVDATSSFAFVTESNLNRVAIIDASQRVARAFVPVGNNPVAVAARPDSLKAYVLNNGDSTVSVISTQENAVIGAPIPVGVSPVAIAIQTGGAYAYVASDVGNSLSVIDTSTDTEIQRVTGLAGPKKLVWDNRLRRVYVVNSGGSISIFSASAAQLELIRTVTTSASQVGIGVLDDGSKFYVLYAGTPGTVDVFDAQSFTVRKTITVQNDPVSIAASPGASKVYVVNRSGDPATAVLANGSISIIKTLDDSVLNIPPSGPNPVFVTAQ